MIQNPLVTIQIDKATKGVNMTRTVLGLDLGTNSIGWALIREDSNNPEQSKLIDLGVRVFPEGVDNFDSSKEVSRNESRRIARGMRRQVRRRRRRRDIVRTALIQCGLLPEKSQDLNFLLSTNPYVLRAKALSEKLELFEFGRVLFHLAQRRGFLSNRKKDRTDNEAKGMLAEIDQNQKDLHNANCSTIGQWLYQKSLDLDHRERIENDHVRRRHLSRQQYIDEFEAIWNAQAKYYPKKLTTELKLGCFGNRKYPVKPIRSNKSETPLEAFGIFGLIYFQRPMYWPRSVVGLCELEPKQKRCPRSDRLYQRFRLLQEVNNLEYIDPDTGRDRQLQPWQRELLLKGLSCTEKLSFDQIRRQLNFLDNVKFNLERGKRSGLLGAPIDALFAAKGVIGKSWYDRDESERNLIVRTLLENEHDDDRIKNLAVSEWGMSESQAEAILGVDLKPGYGNLSRTALEKLVPHMERGLVYMGKDESDSALHAAGYFRRDQLQRRIFDRLPDPSRTKHCPIGDIPNPVVKRTLTELRKLVNAVIREYGKPDAVHIELARSVQQGKKKRDEYSKLIREREEKRKAIVKELEVAKIRVNRDSILKYQLWKEQGLQCIYSGREISFSQLFSDEGGVDIDHILPRSRSLDNAQANKVLCFNSENAAKGNQTPTEWLAAKNPEKLHQICERAGKLLRDGTISYSKYRRFIQKEVELDSFIARQLTDTAYITRATVEYVKCLFDNEHEVLGLKGQLTAELRWLWGLETILSEIPDSPAWQTTNILRDGEKNRADHRHHAIDALVVALTNRSRLQQLSSIVKKGGARTLGEKMESPWSNFRDTIKQRIASVNVSHRVERKIRGALHEETYYGRSDQDKVWVVRKTLASLSPNEIPKIRDQTLREFVLAKLKQEEVDLNSKSKTDEKKRQEILSRLTMPSGVPIKKVRISKPEETITKLRPNQPSDTFYVKPGSTHHLCIFERMEKGKTKRLATFTTMMEAAQRLNRREPLIQRIHPEYPDARFVMSLARGETVLANLGGQQTLLVFRTAAQTQGQIYFAQHTDARKSKEYGKIAKNANTLDAQKVTIDPIGRLRWAND